MKCLLDVAFSQGKLPDTWTDIRGCPSFEGGALRTRQGLLARVPVPGPGWQALRLELDVQPIAPSHISATDDLRSFGADFAQGFHFLGSTRSVPRLTNRQRIEPREGTRRLVFEVDHGQARILLDGRELVGGPDPMPGPALGYWSLHFNGDWLVHRVAVFGADPLPEPRRSGAPKPRGEFHLEVAVDFNSDVKRAPWTRDLLDKFFAEFRSWGVKRCHWIWVGERDGWDDARINPYAPGFARQTVENIGDIFPAAVRAAHAHGVELYGLFKPFEVGEFGRFAHAVGASTASAYTLARKPGAWGPARNAAFTRIDLVKEDDQPAAFGVRELELFVSDDNETYLPYRGPIAREETVEDYAVWEHTSGGGRPTGRTQRARVLRLGNLHIRNRYAAVCVKGRNGSFANSLVNLIHVFGEKGEERLLTYGLPAPRPQSMWTQTSAIQFGEEAGVSAGRMLSHILFGESLAQPTANIPGYNAMAMRHVLDSRDSFLAVARDKERGIASLSPSFQESRDWWLSQLKIMLEAGADGIELRFRHHQSPQSWAEYGFEPPVRDAFLARYGVDLWTTDDFDAAAWRALRGEGYTEFCRQARKLTRSFGKRLGLHTGPIEECAALDMQWDWRAWVDEGLADSLTMKELWPHTRLAEEVLSHTRPRGTRVIFSPYANTIWNAPGGEAICAERIRLAQEHGYDGFQFYESAAITRATPQGEILMIQPALRELFQKTFARQAVNP